MLDLARIQEEGRVWTNRNFPKQETWQPLLGIGEEVGELYHAYLKRTQGIRQAEDHDEGIEDAIGDIYIFLMNFASHVGIDMETAISKTWDKVSKRDWVENPVDGTSDGS